jgi:hypothetical protein
VKLSPSLFFQEAIPPSVMVGDIAGISNLVMARRADVAVSPVVSRSGVGYAERYNVETNRYIFASGKELV